MKTLGAIVLGLAVAGTLAVFGASAADEGFEVGFQGRLTDVAIALHAPRHGLASGRVGERPGAQRGDKTAVVHRG